ncbi:MAG: MBL fold metallo-hydrolase, partial [Candidatus Puniceispirillaceae bacterium]
MSIKAASKAPEVKAFFDNDSNTVSYVVTDPATKKAAIIDSVMDFDYASGTISYDHADMIIEYVTTQKLDVEWLIETHVHADHLSAAPYIQQKLGGKLGISDRISEVQ